MLGRLRPLVPALLAAGLLFLLGAGPLNAGICDCCGNGTTEAPELCDDGNTAGGDGCSYPSCLPEVCGDGVLNPDPAPGPAEACDDGNTAGDDGCDASCELECGNGTLEGSEACDTSGESPTCNDDCTVAECGDGNVNEPAGETCDDGNTVSGDGCESGCDNSEQMPRDQQACVNAVNTDALGVLKAQGKDVRRCFKSAAAGQSTVATCLGTDVDGRVAKAEARTVSTTTRKCTGESTPTFAYTTPTTVNDGATDASLDSVATVFGTPPNIVAKATDEAGAACQAEVARRHFKLLGTWAAEANKAKRSALKGNKTTPWVGNGPALATAIDVAVAASEKITKAENGVNLGIAKKCPDATVPVDPLFHCGGSTTGNGLALCVIAAAKRGACVALEAADALALACPGDV